jgi:uncharacterized protein YkwD
MRVPIWLAGIVVVGVVGYGAVTALKAVDTHALPASQTALATAPGPNDSVFDHWPQRESPRASPSPTPPVAARPKAPVAPTPVRSVAPAIVIGSTQQRLINQDRAAHGLRPLTWSSCLASIARSNAVRMANQGYISHTNGATRDLGCHLGNHAGENVGYWSGGIDDAKLNSMFMASPGHRANILSGYYHYVGTAWVVAPNGAGYLAVEFS